jgi:hypothetical protein
MSMHQFKSQHNGIAYPSWPPGNLLNPPKQQWTLHELSTPRVEGSQDSTAALQREAQLKVYRDARKDLRQHKRGSQDRELTRSKAMPALSTLPEEILQSTEGVPETLRVMKKRDKKPHH